MFVTPAAADLNIAPRENYRVKTYTADDLPRPFWSRASQSKECSIRIDEDLARIERAELHVVIWDGGAGKVEHPLKLNGHPVKVEGKGRHDVLYRRVPVDPSTLRRGVNKVLLHCETEHHGIEVLLPGPSIVVRSRVAE